MKNDTLSLGKIIAAIHSVSWYKNPPTLSVSQEEISAVETLIAFAGSSGLAWRRMDRAGMKAGDFIFSMIQQNHRYVSLESALRCRELKGLFEFLNRNRINPILGKGWAIARLYPDQNLRPLGDFDLYYDPDRFDDAIDAIGSPMAPSCHIDWHRGSSELNDRNFDELYQRSEIIDLEGTGIRIFGPEDHLRLLAIHMLRHGAWRALWLCDIAVAFEARPGNFDWDYFLSGDERRTQWVIAAIGLAHQLLGAEIAGTPIEAQARKLPRWLVPTVLRQWGTPPHPHGARVPMHHYLRHPDGIINALKIRWPNGIEATVGMHGPFNEWPRLPFQIGECLRRVASWVRPGSALGAQASCLHE